MDAAGAARRDSRADFCALLLELATLEKVLHYHHVSSEPFALLCIVSMLMQITYCHSYHISYYYYPVGGLPKCAERVLYTHICL